MRVYLPRFYVQAPEQNLDQFSADCEEAAASGADLAVFPEQFITGYHGTLSPDAIKSTFAAVSSQNPSLLICCGTISEDGQNRQYWYLAGRECASYAKVHLFLPNEEDKLWQAGSAYASLAHDDLKIGLGTCNDVRFPEQMHALSRSGKLHLLVYPALWPWQRDSTWAALLRARAIEHAAFCIGCCVAGVQHGTERFDGAGNHVFDPFGNPVAAHGRYYELDMELSSKPLVNTQAQYAEITQIERFKI